MEHQEHLLPGLVILFVLGVSTQWIAWRIRVPAILLLLGIGSLAGSYLKFIDPEAVFGDLLLPIVSLSVGLILFEGGLNLNFSELKNTRRSLIGLLTVGVLVTWVLTAIAAVTILEMRPSVAILLGSVLVVTGPTVIGPLLRDIRPSGKVGVLAKWEGIVIDPVGAILAVLVFNAITPLTDGDYRDVLWSSLGSLSATLVVGVLGGLLPAMALAWLMRRFLLPDYLQNPMSLMLVLGTFAACNTLQDESGLLAVTVMGIALANTKHIDISKIIEFKESIATLLISTLFIILSARVPLDKLFDLGIRGPLFAAALIVLVRPIAVWVSTFGSGLSWQERGFLACFAPRGIVAAAVTSVFALRLEERGEAMVPATFWVIFGTVAVYGLSAGWIARRFSLAVADAQGLLIAGANKTAREIAAALKTIDFSVTLIDTQFPRIRRTTRAGLNGVFANVLSEEVLDLVNFGGIGKFLAMTSNDQVNTLAAIRFRELFGSSNVYQLRSNEVRPAYLETRWQNHIAGRTLFSDDLTYEKLDALFAGGATLTVADADTVLATFADAEGSTAATGGPLYYREELRRRQEAQIRSEETAVAAAPVAAAASSAASAGVVASAGHGSASRRPAKGPELPPPAAWPLMLVDGRRLLVCSTDTRSSFRSGQRVLLLHPQPLELIDVADDDE